MDTIKPQLRLRFFVVALFQSMFLHDMGRPLEKGRAKGAG